MEEHPIAKCLKDPKCIKEVVEEANKEQRKIMKQAKEQDKIEEKPLMIGEEELGEKIGKTTVCPICKKEHKVKYGKDAQTGKESKMLGFVDCPDTKKSYLVAVNQRLIK